MSTSAGRMVHSMWDIPAAWAGADGETGSSVTPRPIESNAFVVAIVTAMVAPWLVHLVPISGGPLGPMLLPIFYAPFLAALMLRLPVAIAATVAAPIVSRYLTGMPPEVILPGLLLQLACFVVVVRILRSLPWMVVAPVAYVGGLVAAAILSRAAGIGTIDAVGTVQVGWLGIAVLAGLGLVADRLLRRTTH